MASDILETYRALSVAFEVANRNLDIDRVRETLSLLEKALDQSDLLPVFEKLRERR